MTPYEEAACYHDPTRRGFFALLVNGIQTNYRLSELVTVLEAIPSNADVWLGQGEFYSPDRRLVHLARLGLCFTDCETFKSRYANLTPEQQAQVFVLHCEDNGLPCPSLINFSGRGIHVKWAFDVPIPAEALPRWNAVQKALQDGLKDFTPDRAARDGSRCLRAVGTLNSRSGQTARVVWADERNGAINRWDFDALCREVLPVERGVLQKKRAVTSAAKQTAGKCNLWQPRQLWWNRLGDVRRLVELRGWTNGVPEGARNNFLFVAACAVSWGMESANLRAEVETLAQEFCPTLRPSEVRATTASVIAKAQAGTRFKMTNIRLIELLDVQGDEQRYLRTIFDPDERKRRKRSYDNKRKWGETDRDTYEAQAQVRREQAQALRASGLTRRQIAEQMRCTVNAIDTLLRAASTR